MTMSLNTLSARIQSAVPGPVALYGYSIERPEVYQTVYDGQSLPRFLLDQGGNPTQFREFLTLNRIGSVFTLEAGRVVVMPNKQNDFAKHPEA